jgi:hypothetical protein
MGLALLSHIAHIPFFLGDAIIAFTFTCGRPEKIWNQNDTIHKIPKNLEGNGKNFAGQFFFIFLPGFVTIFFSSKTFLETVLYFNGSDRYCFWDQAGGHAV